MYFFMYFSRHNVVRTSVIYFVSCAICLLLPRCEVTCASITEQTTTKWNLFVKWMHLRSCKSTQKSLYETLKYFPNSKISFQKNFFRDLATCYVHNSMKYAKP